MQDKRIILQEKYEITLKRIEEIENIRNQTYKTSCQFKYNPTNEYSKIDISTCTNLKALIEINAFLKMKEIQYLESAKDLEIKEFPVYTWNGYTPALWHEDIKLRISILSMDSELNKLRDLKAKIQPFLPDDHKISQLLLEIGE